MIVIINGPPGIGKSTIAQKLTKKLKRSTCIEVDRVKYFSIDRRKTTEAIDIGDQQVFMMVRALREGSKGCIILDYVYESPKYFQAVVRQLRSLDRNIYAFRLRAVPSEITHRDTRRPKRVQMGARARELAERLDERGDAVGYTVETTGLSVEKTAEKIFMLINAEIGLV